MNISVILVVIFAAIIQDCYGSYQYQQVATKLSEFLINSPESFDAHVKFVKFDNVKVYLPSLFRSIRVRFGIDDIQFAVSLQGNQIPVMDCQSKSKQSFHYSGDKKYLIKTISRKEMHCLELLCQNPEFCKDGNSSITCINPVLIAFRIQSQLSSTFWQKWLPKQVRWMLTSHRYFIVMPNIFFAESNLASLMTECASDHSQLENNIAGKRKFWRYDLKGSSIGRSAEAKSLFGKDNDIVRENIGFCLGEYNRNGLLSGLTGDVEFLAQNNIMDYSLLVGIEPIERAYHQDWFCRRGLVQSFLGKPVLFRPQASTEITNFQRPRAKLSPWSLLLKKHSSNGNEIASCCRRNGILMMVGDDNLLYKFGIVDILQKFTQRKKLESTLKSIFWDKAKISCVDPRYYSVRFLNFITANIKS